LPILQSTYFVNLNTYIINLINAYNNVQKTFVSGEVRCLYRSFKQECPNGIVDEETFKEVYEKIFPLGDATHYAHLVFAAIDRQVFKVFNVCLLINYPSQAKGGKSLEILYRDKNA